MANALSMAWSKYCFASGMLMRKVCHFLILFLPVHAVAIAAEEATLYLRVGQRYPLEGLVAQNVTISPESVAQAHQTPEGTLLVGKSAGSAQLTLETPERTLHLRVIVRDNPQSEPQNPWSRTLVELRKLPGLHISQFGKKTLVQGEILGRQAYQRVLLHLRNFPANLLVLATPAPGIKASLMEQTHSLLSSRGLTDVHVSNAGNRFFLEGSVSTPPEVEQAFETVQTIIPNVENHLAIPIRIDPTISVRVFILELSRQAHQALGLSWPGLVQGAAVITPQTQIFSPLWTANLKHMADKGQARILAEPMLAVKAGSHAELSAGGEIPLRITGRYENKVVWKHYGLKVRIHIAGLAGKHIRTRIETESSQLDEATTVDGIPGIRTNRMSTEVDVLEGKPILLTGLFHSEAAKDVSKLPILGNIPLFGELFKSRRFRKRESELLVALLPTFGAQGTDIPLRSARGLEFDARWRILD